MKQKTIDEKGKSATQILVYLKERIEEYLNALNECADSDFLYGEKTAYVECLEIIQRWQEAESVGLHYSIEERYPL